MRIAMLGPYPQVESAVLGGVEAVVLSLLTHLAELPDVELNVLTCQPGIVKPYARLATYGDTSAKWTIHYVPRLGKARKDFRWGNTLENAAIWCPSYES